jgi:ribosomal protein S18 acetylase RimI-like enzyme
MSAVTIEVCRAVSDGLYDAMTRLVPQLSSSATVPSVDQLREIVTTEGTFLLLARDGDRIVGTLTLVTFRIPTGVRAWIEDVAVESQARGKGIGEALSREAIRIAASRDARTVELTSRPSREAANRLYRRIGFEPRDTNVYRYTIGDRGVPKASR